MKILFLIRDLEYRGGAKQLSLMAPELPPERFETCTAMLAGNGPFSRSLRAAGVRVEALGWNRLVDVRPFWRLRNLLGSFRPDLIHCWDLTALRALTLSGNRQGSRMIATLPFHCQYSRLARWLFRRSDLLTVQSPAEQDFWHSRGVTHLAVIPPAVAPFRNPGVNRSEVYRQFGLPANARWLLCVGPLEMHKGFKDAIWAFNILGYLYPDLYLLLVGDGPDRERLERLSTSYFPGRVLLLGTPADIRGVLAHAEVVWAPSRQPGGINVVLEAMAAGKPVVASALPALAEIIVHGETGFLVPPGDKVAFARQTRLLLENDDLRVRMGETGRQRAETRYSVGQLVRRFADLYESGVGGQNASLAQAPRWRLGSKASARGRIAGWKV